MPSLLEVGGLEEQWWDQGLTRSSVVARDRVSGCFWEVTRKKNGGWGAVEGEEEWKEGSGRKEAAQILRNYASQQQENKSKITEDDK